MYSTIISAGAALGCCIFIIDPLKKSVFVAITIIKMAAINTPPIAILEITPGVNFVIFGTIFFLLFVFDYVYYTIFN